MVRKKFHPEEWVDAAIVSAVHAWGPFWLCSKILFHCDNKSVVDVWDKGSTYTHYGLGKAIIYLCSSPPIECMCSARSWCLQWYRRCLISFSNGKVPEISPNSQSDAGQHPCMTDTGLHASLLQCQNCGVSQSTCCTYKSGLTKFHAFCSRYKLLTRPAPSLTLQYFCVHEVYHISYKLSKCI